MLAPSVCCCLGLTNCMPAYSLASTSGLSRSGSNCCSCCCCCRCCVLNSVSLGLAGSCRVCTTGAETVRWAGATGSDVMGVLCVLVKCSRRKSTVEGCWLRCILAACWRGEVSEELLLLLPLLAFALFVDVLLVARMSYSLRLLLCSLLELRELAMSLL